MTSSVIASIRPLPTSSSPTNASIGVRSIAAVYRWIGDELCCSISFTSRKDVRHNLSKSCKIMYPDNYWITAWAGGFGMELIVIEERDVIEKT